jgi:hypothetical protein
VTFWLGYLSACSALCAAVNVALRIDDASLAEYLACNGLMLAYLLGPPVADRIRRR